MKERNNKTDEEYSVLAENRHLKDTIAVLRDQLEAMRYQQDEAIQKAVASSSDEISQLRSALSALRETMETKAAEYAASLQEERRLHRDELEQLQRTIKALRESLTEAVASTPVK
jgi:hypothetical protein